jgi:amino acid transporter
MLTEYLFIGGSVLGILVLRRSRPDMDRPIKVNLFFPVTFVAIVFAIIAVIVYTSPLDSLMCLLVILAGVPVYGVFIAMQKPKSIDDKISKAISFVWHPERVMVFSTQEK